MIDEVKKHPVRSAGWVARLYSGQAETELQGPEEVRGVTRARGIQVKTSKISIGCQVCLQSAVTRA